MSLTKSSSNLALPTASPSLGRFVGMVKLNGPVWLVAGDDEVRVTPGAVVS